MSTPTPGRRSPVFSVLDAQYAETAFGAGPPASPANPGQINRPAFAESFYSDTATSRVCSTACASTHGMPELMQLCQTI